MARPFGTKKISNIEFEQIVEDYFNDCDKRNAPYTIEGLACFTGIDRRTLYNYSKDEDYFPTIKKAKERVLQQMSERAINGDANATISIFLLKNNYGYVDSQQIDAKVDSTVKYEVSFDED